MRRELAPPGCIPRTYSHVLAYRPRCRFIHQHGSSKGGDYFLGGQFSLAEVGVEDTSLPHQSALTSCYRRPKCCLLDLPASMHKTNNVSHPHTRSARWALCSARRWH